VRSPDAIVEALRAAPDAAAALDALSMVPGVWVVGGAVRDVLLGREPRELDVVVEGDPAAAIAALGGATVIHDRFGTATVVPPDGGRAVDVVRARAESYPAPGALPEVRPGTLDEDLARRDVTVNAIAVRVGGPGPAELRTVPRAADDLAAGILRVLHDESFRDDPTRLWRIARYASRLGFDADPHTRALARDADPSTVSGPRLGNELRLALREPDPLDVLRRARSLHPGLLPETLDLEPSGLDAALALLPGSGRADLVVLAACARAVDLPSLLAWLDDLAFPAADRDIVAAGSREMLAGPLRAARSNAEVARAARGVPLEVVALAGGEQARRWIDDLRHVQLDITGDDLLAAGLKQGPELGARLAAALDAKLDGRASGRDDELAVALGRGGEDA
jgi:tRNA nucleotidyltransferase (CCA-adding enzyme)